MRQLFLKLFGACMICFCTMGMTFMGNAKAKDSAVMKKDYAFLYQLTNSSMASLSKASIVVTDPDYGDNDTPLDARKIAQLRAGGTMVILYKSIGEASDYRDYWKKGRFSEVHPDFILEANDEWKGDFKVKFWDTKWQAIVFEDIESIARRGADGVYMDIIDGYQHEAVIEAFQKDQLVGKVMQASPYDAMVDFVVAISQRAKAINPNMKIFPQNGSGLLTIGGEGEQSNMRYLNAIDGIGVEDTWSNGNKSITWTTWTLNNLRHIVHHKKTVLATDYPTDPVLQKAFIDKALAQGFIPFVGARALSKDVPAINKTIPARLGW